ncbi:protein kinase C-binding protein 1-like [Limulus polyphemus]|uniref:Protein kinase C-binding protein 1-like n=1 Tax=Limulus polyphemus TaxID=6850 RepID=A0ABM1S0I2_LIMPO|nr:protein kinase C-binding protein 1-like [Limulus polyphemus]
MKHNHKLTLLEVRSSWEQEQKTCVENLKKIHVIEKEKEIEATKKKQWCANCSKEAHFYCCWNTSYCNHSCQQAHWPIHVNTCSQTRESFMTSLPDTST